MEAKKKKIVVVYVEAGQGHIVTAQAIAESIQKKYGNEVEVVHNYLFKDTNDKDLLKHGKLLINEVKKTNRHKLRLYIQYFFMKLAGDSKGLRFVYNTVYKKVKEKAIQALQALNADIIITTHFLPLHFAIEGKRNGQLKKDLQVIAYNPDPTVHGWWDNRADLFINNNPKATALCIKKHFDKSKLVEVNFVTRQSITQETHTKSQLRQELNIPQDKFAVILADGAYAGAKMREYTDKLLTTKKPLTIISVLGKNQKLLEKYKKITNISHNITFMPIGFSNEIHKYYKAADLFITKAGPNAILDSILMGTPVMTNFYSGPIEEATNELYINQYNVGIYCNSASKGLKFVERCIDDSSVLQPYIDNIKKRYNNFKNGADEIADIIMKL